MQPTLPDKAPSVIGPKGLQAHRVRFRRPDDAERTVGTAAKQKSRAPFSRHPRTAQARSRRVPPAEDSRLEGGCASTAAPATARSSCRLASAIFARAGEYGGRPRGWRRCHAACVRRFSRRSAGRTHRLIAISRTRSAVDDPLRQRQSRRAAGRSRHRHAASHRRRSAVGRPPSAGRGRARGRGLAATGTCHIAGCPVPAARRRCRAGLTQLAGGDAAGKMARSSVSSR